MLIKRGKTAETAMKLGAAQIANAEYNNFMNNIFGGTKMIVAGKVPDINRVKEYINNSTQAMNYDQKRKFRKEFLELAVKGFSSEFTGEGENRSFSAQTIKKLAKNMFGESTAQQVLKDYND